MNRNLLLVFFLAAGVAACAQKTEAPALTEVKRIENILASDDMRGRRAGTPDIDRAADFIAKEFQNAGLKPFSKSGFRQEFVMVRPKLVQVKAEINDEEIDAKQVMVVTTQPELKVDESSGYEWASIKAGENLGDRSRAFIDAGKNLVVMVDTAFTQNFPRLSFYRNQMFPRTSSVIFVLGNYAAKEYKFKAEHTISEVKYANVAGILPGKSKASEYVIFSAHYDHLGVSRQPKDGDSIYNGANDNAAGTTGVILLADHFRKLGNNERTIIFVAFTAEESGGFGSRYFSQQLDPKSVMAMINIEMIGTESKWGKNSAYITGFEKTDMGAIMKKNLKGSDFNFHPDPYTKENLFYRSDNATLARLGVPAHTISTAKMEGEPNYHQLTDHVETLDLENMARIINAIALSATSIISGKDTPGRVKPEQLN
ncbi:MAG: M28 family metallopeptidase [Flavisolibacter sp.]